MPLGFPSHQGLLAPLWRRWPDRVSVLALWVGAIVPDCIDGAASIAVRGQFQQWIGHSPIGATVLGVPVGLAMTAGLRRAARRLARIAGGGRLHRALRRLGTWIVAVDNADATAPPAARLGFDAFSVWIGVLSHVLFDLFSHEHSRLLWPFAVDPHWLGAWWHTAWFRVSVPGYPDYPIGPHFVGWLVLSVGGAVMFLRWPPEARRGG